MNWSPVSMKAIPRLAAAQAQLEDPAVEGERLLDVADIEGDVVDPDEPRGHARACAAADGSRDGRRRFARRAGRSAPADRRRAGGRALGIVLSRE